jgi:hypothetical protein
MAFGLYMCIPLCLYTNPLIYATAYIGPEKSKSQLRISEKKFGRKKMPSWTRQNISLSGNLAKPKKLSQTISNFFTRFDGGFHELSSTL